MLPAYGLVKAVEALGLPHPQPLLLAALVVAVWALLTRMLHFDGLADVADGFWGATTLRGGWRSWPTATPARSARPRSR